MQEQILKIVIYSYVCYLNLYFGLKTESKLYYGFMQTRRAGLCVLGGSEPSCLLDKRGDITVIKGVLFCFILGQRGFHTDFICSILHSEQPPVAFATNITLSQCKSRLNFSTQRHPNPVKCVTVPVHNPQSQVSLTPQILKVV